MFERLKLAKRIDQLEEQMVKLTRVVQDKDLDWDDMRSRCKRLLDRTEKAARRVVQSEDTAAAGEAAQPDGTGRTGRLLTAHQLEIQQQILKRRGGL